MVHARFIEKALLAFWVIIMNKSGIGAIGENIAQKYLAKQGYKIIAKNCIFAGCELDIVCILPKNKQKMILKRKYKNGEIKSEGALKFLLESACDTLVFVEVKYSSTRIYGEPFERVDIHKQNQIIKASQIFCTKNQISLPCRFDVVSIVGDDINHIENAFESRF